MKISGKPQIVIIGNGITGITAAIALRAENKDVTITVISEETELFYSRTALMYVYMRQLKFSDTVVHPARFFRDRKIGLKFASVVSVDYPAKTVNLQGGEKLTYDCLLLAPGSQPRLPGIPGENLAGVQGLYSKADLDRLEKNSGRTAHAVIAGGGLIGVELAEMLHTRGIPFTFLVRDALYFSGVLPQAEAAMVTEEIKSHGINLRLSAQLAAIEGNTADHVTAVVTGKGERIPCSLVGLTIGVKPRLELIADSPVAGNQGILTNEYLQTNLPEVFAAGDAAEVVLPGGGRKVQQLWYTGRMQGSLAGHNLAQAVSGGNLKPYDPGIFFNSAKFFGLEYQTYGQVPPAASPDNSILWQNEKDRKLIRIFYENTGGEKIVKGFNVLGVRYRHQVCETWIGEKAPLKKVLAELDQANFDPEFYSRYEENIRSATA